MNKSISTVSKIKILLHTKGTDVQDISYTLNDTEIDYKKAAEKL